MSDLLIDANLLTELRALETSGMSQTATITRDGSAVAADVPISLVLPGSARVQPAPIGLGGGRGTWIAYLPWGTDLQDGDVITLAGREYAIEGAATLDTCVAASLSEVGRG